MTDTQAEKPSAEKQKADEIEQELLEAMKSLRRKNKKV